MKMKLICVLTSYYAQYIEHVYIKELRNSLIN